MTRKLKALGLALFAAFAFSAIAVQAASAHQFITTGEETTVLTGHQESGENAHTFTVNETVLTCHIATFSGTVSGVSADHVTVATTYDECHSNVNKATGSAIVHSNGCTYTFHSDTVENHAPVSLVCPPEKNITITASGCVIHIPPFETKSGVTYTNLTNHGPGEKDAVTVKATVEGIEAISTGGLACLAAGLGFETKVHESVYKGGTEVTGYEDAGSNPENHEYVEGTGQTNIWVEGAPE